MIIILYLVGALITGLCTYIYYGFKYKKEADPQQWSFTDWMSYWDYYEIICFISFIWPIFVSGLIVWLIFKCIMSYLMSLIRKLFDV